MDYFMPKVKDCIQNIGNIHPISRINISICEGKELKSTNGILKFDDQRYIPRLIQDAWVDKYSIEIIGDVEVILHLFISYRHMLDMPYEVARDFPSLEDMKYDFTDKLYEMRKNRFIITEFVYDMVKDTLTLLSILNRHFDIKFSIQYLAIYLDTRYNGLVKLMPQFLCALNDLNYISIIKEDYKDKFASSDYITAFYDVADIDIRQHVLEIIDVCLYHIKIENSIGMIKCIVKCLINSNTDYTELLTVIDCMLRSFDKYYGLQPLNQIRDIYTMIEREYEYICDIDKSE